MTNMDSDLKSDYFNSVKKLGTVNKNNTPNVTVDNIDVINSNTKQKDKGNLKELFLKESKIVHSKSLKQKNNIDKFNTITKQNNLNEVTFDCVPLLGVFYTHESNLIYLKIGNTTALSGVSITTYWLRTNLSTKQEQPNLIKVRFKKSKKVFMYRPRN